jgi:hypothetical protein
MNRLRFILNSNRIQVTALLLFITISWLNGQGNSYSYFYRVYFKDKGSYNTETFTPLQLLSQKALDRRNRSGITVPDMKDLPVFTDYLNQISAKGFTLHCTSKWINSALFKTHNSADINILLNLPFVTDVKIVKRPSAKSAYSGKLDFQTYQSNDTPFDRSITMVNGYPLHNSGFTGKNILIAILDGGFENTNLISSTSHLRVRNGIKATFDFVNKSSNVYYSTTHGTAVLSILAGMIPGSLEGSAPGADYLLLKTEDVSTEFPCEEDFWAAGAEYADSSGADIISSSLGYFNFDEPTLNYKITDLDGNTAFVTKAAEIASLKGILVVNSAGNERNHPWQKIIFPADGKTVLTSAAVDGENLISSFSSAGPSTDGRVKPDLSTLGVDVALQISQGKAARGNGTSFSCPVLSGMAASLMQAVPDADNKDIIEALQRSADRYNTPDSLYGYGIPDMVTALDLLQDKYVIRPDAESVIFPNPSKGEFEIIFKEPQSEIWIEIISMTGKVIFNEEYSNFAGRTLRISELANSEQGIYFLKLATGKGTHVLKIIKLRD